jgi:hypothetical protein
MMTIFYNFEALEWWNLLLCGRRWKKEGKNYSLVLLMRVMEEDEGVVL